MLKRILVIGIIIAGFFFYFPVMASEDSGEYPFPEDFSFDDLPDIELEPTVPLETTKIENTTTITTNAVEDKTPLVTTNTVAPKGNIDTVEIDEDVNNIETKNTKKANIFIPSKDNNNDVGSDNSFDKEKSLTEALKNTSSSEEVKAPLKGTWMEKITTSNPLSLLGVKDDEDDSTDDGESQLKKLVKNARNKAAGGASRW